MKHNDFDRITNLFGSGSNVKEPDFIKAMKKLSKHEIFELLTELGYSSQPNMIMEMVVYCKNHWGD